MIPGAHLAELAAHQSTYLPLAELFGPTIQGEGPYAGRLCSFVRLGKCNLSCKYCDTPYTWDASRYDLAEECPETSVADILAALTKAPITVVSGGEPLLHQRKPAFVDLLTRLGRHSDVHIETNGTIPPTDQVISLVRHFTVSPKLANAGDPARKRIRPRALAVFADLARQGRACFKFVATDEPDLDEAATIVQTHDIPPHTVWVMPEGTDPDRLIRTHRQLVGHVIRHGWNTTTRLHNLLWGDERQR